MLIKHLLKKYFLVVGTGLLAAAANASTLTIDSFMQYDRAAKGPGSPMTVYGDYGATLPGGIQRQLSVSGAVTGIVDLSVSGSQVNSTQYNPSTGSSNYDTYRILEINYSASTPLNLLLGGASATDMIMSLHCETIPSIDVNFEFISSSGSYAYWSFSRGSNSSGLISSSLGSINPTFNWGSVNNISIGISSAQGGRITLGKDNLGFRVVSVPEPSTCVLFGLGAFLLVAYRRKVA